MRRPSLPCAIWRPRTSAGSPGSTGFSSIASTSIGTAPSWRRTATGTSRPISTCAFPPPTSRPRRGSSTAATGGGRRPPASDAPARARELYRRTRLRIIPDAGYTPVPVESHDPAPLDLSDSVLRSVSPVHLEYMRNMGTLASMSISILRDGRLWGLISCHNREPRRVSFQVRDTCDFLTQIFSLQLEARENTELAERRVRLGAVGARLLAHMAAGEHVTAGVAMPR